MVLFDYGQTLIAEQKFDGVKGTAAVLQYATRNKYHLSAAQVQAKANEIHQEYMEQRMLRTDCKNHFNPFFLPD